MKAILLILCLVLLSSAVLAEPLFMQVKGEVTDEDGKSATVDMQITVGGQTFFNDTVTASYGKNAPIYLTTTDSTDKVRFFLNGKEVDMITFQPDEIVVTDFVIKSTHSLPLTQKEKESKPLEINGKEMDLMTWILIVLVAFLVWKMFSKGKGKQSNSPI